MTEMLWKIPEIIDFRERCRIRHYKTIYKIIVATITLWDNLVSDSNPESCIHAYNMVINENGADFEYTNLGLSLLDTYESDKIYMEYWNVTRENVSFYNKYINHKNIYNLMIYVMKEVSHLLNINKYKSCYELFDETDCDISVCVTTDIYDSLSEVYSYIFKKECIDKTLNLLINNIELFDFKYKTSRFPRSIQNNYIVEKYSKILLHKLNDADKDFMRMFLLVHKHFVIELMNYHIQSKTQMLCERYIINKYENNSKFSIENLKRVCNILTTQMTEPFESFEAGIRIVTHIIFTSILKNIDNNIKNSILESIDKIFNSKTTSVTTSIITSVDAIYPTISISNPLPLSVPVPLSVPLPVPVPLSVPLSVPVPLPVPVQNTSDTSDCGLNMNVQTLNNTINSNLQPGIIKHISLETAISEYYKFLDLIFVKYTCKCAYTNRWECTCFDKIVLYYIQLGSSANEKTEQQREKLLFKEIYFEKWFNMIFLSRLQLSPYYKDYDIGIWLQWKIYQYKKRLTTSIDIPIVQQIVSYKKYPYNETRYSNYNPLKTDYEYMNILNEYCMEDKFPWYDLMDYKFYYIMRWKSNCPVKSEHFLKYSIEKQILMYYMKNNAAVYYLRHDLRCFRIKFKKCTTTNERYKYINKIIKTSTELKDDSWKFFFYQQIQDKLLSFDDLKSNISTAHMNELISFIANLNTASTQRSKIAHKYNISTTSLPPPTVPPTVPPLSTVGGGPVGGEPVGGVVDKKNIDHKNETRPVKFMLIHWNNNSNMYKIKGDYINLHKSNLEIEYWENRIDDNDEFYTPEQIESKIEEWTNKAKYYNETGDSDKEYEAYDWIEYWEAM